MSHGNRWWRMSSKLSLITRFVCVWTSFSTNFWWILFLLFEWIHSSKDQQCSHADAEHMTPETLYVNQHLHPSLTWQGFQDMSDSGNLPWVSLLWRKVSVGDGFRRMSHGPQHFETTGVSRHGRLRQLTLSVSPVEESIGGGRFSSNVTWTPTFRKQQLSRKGLSQRVQNHNQHRVSRIELVFLTVQTKIHVKM